MFGGRLTLASGKPVLDADITSSTLYYTQDCGDKVSVGGSDISFTESAISLAGLPANAIYDVFIASDASLFLSAAWTAGGESFVTPISAITDGTGAVGWLRSSAAFDGVTSQSYAVGARLNGASNAGYANCLGQDWGSSKIISKVVIYAPNDDYLRGDASNALPVEIDGWNGSAWVSIYEGFLDASIAPPAPAYTIPLPRIPYLKHRVCLGGNSVNAVNFAEIQFYEWKDTVRTDTLARNNGIVTNAANTGTHLGTIQIDSAGGTCTAHFSQGGQRRYGVWNRYNQRPIFLRGGADVPITPGTPNYYVPTAVIPAWGPVHNNADNNLQIITGDVTQFDINLQMTRGVFAGTGAPNTSGQHQCAIGINRTDLSEWPLSGYTLEVGALSTALLNSFVASAPFISAPLTGLTTVYALENHRSSSVFAWSGNRDMLFYAKWWG